MESMRRLLPGTSVILQVSLDAGTLTVRALVTRCTVHALQSDTVWYRGALEFDEEITTGAIVPPRL